MGFSIEMTRELVKIQNDFTLFQRHAYLRMNVHIQNGVV